MINLDRFKDRSPEPIGSLRKSAVMILVTGTPRGQFLILEKRALSLRSQPGDISLPGGRMEEGRVRFERHSAKPARNWALPWTILK